MGSYEDELMNVLIANADKYKTPYYYYTEETLYELRDFIIEKFGIGYEECDKCGEFKPAIFCEDGVFCHDCCKKLGIEF